MKQAKPPVGYTVRVQKVDRPTNRSYYVNLPVVLAEAMQIQKAEAMEWVIEDKNLLLLCRKQKKPPRKLRAKS
jgi:hypothetical protein